MPFLGLPDGTRLHTTILGAGGTPVVMLHGLLVGNLATWYFGAGRALAAHRRVLLYDLRGHGRSSRPDAGYDVQTMTDDLEGLLAQEVAEGPLALVGHSYGALIALEYARRHPGRMSRLALVEAPVETADREALAGFLAREPEEMLEALPGALREAVAAGKRRARRLLAHLVGLATETTLLEDLAHPRAPGLDELLAIRCPALLVYGEGSACRGSADRLLAALPNATLRAVPGGHYLPLEAPALLTELLVDFLESGTDG